MSNNIQTVKIMLDFMQGPIWLTDFETGELLTGIDIVDNDSEIKELNSKCADLYNSYYEFNSHGQACWFDFEKEKADKEIMLSLLNRLISRLNEINDGSFTVEDCETERVKSL